MDSRIADYIREHRSRYTREAITQQLVDAGHERESIDATWAALDTPDPDDTAGEGFWGRWFLILVGINLAVLLLVGLATGALFVSERIGLLGILAVALAIGALISWGIVAATGPAKMGRTTATVIGVAIPLVVALLLGGTCYALLSGMGPPPRTGTLELAVDGMPELTGSGTATCQLGQGTLPGFSVFGQLETSAVGFVTVSLDTFPIEDGPVTNEIRNVMISSEPRSADQPPQSYSSFAGRAQIESEVSRDGLEGTVTFADLPSDMSGPESQGPDAEAISGSVSWTCE